MEHGMFEAFKKARGAGSADGWLGSEIKALPSEMIRRFYRITKRWRSTKKVPHMMKVIRQSSMLKPGKEPKIANLRPLSILSVFWRAFESSLTATKAFAELKRVLAHFEVAFKESAEETAAIIMTLYVEMHNLAALDYSRAFDHMRPEISAELLKAANIPEDVVDTLMQVWGDQIRYVQYDGHTLKEPLKTSSAHPQGGPFGPPLMQLWVLAGVMWTTREERKRKAEEEEKRKKQQRRMTQRGKEVRAENGQEEDIRS
jgi:hypothetical protein